MKQKLQNDEWQVLRFWGKVIKENLTVCAEIDKYTCMTYQHIFGEDLNNDLKSNELKALVSQTEYDILLAGFPEQFANDDEKIVVGSELYTGDFNISKPMYELRCSTSE